MKRIISELDDLKDPDAAERVMNYLYSRFAGGCRND